MHKDEPYSFVTAKIFAEAFRTFHVGQKLDTELCVAFDKSKGHPSSFTTKAYGIKKRELLKACMSREVLFMERRSLIYVTITALIAVMAFTRTEMPKQTLADGGIFTGSLFFAIVRLMFSGVAEIYITISELPVLYKQRDFLLYPAWAYTRYLNGSSKSQSSS